MDEVARLAGPSNRASSKVAPRWNSHPSNRTAPSKIAPLKYTSRSLYTAVNTVSSR